MEQMQIRSGLNHQVAFRFLILLGIISLLTDMSAKGAESILGPYFAVLGANAAIISTVAGFGEFVAYGLRFFTGYLVDRTGWYWSSVSLGYLINLVAVPALAFARHWEFAAMLVIIERAGKALRTPARDTMLSHAGLSLGAGWGFGLHKMMDQIGCMLGPIIVTTVLYFKDCYRINFIILAIPALIALIVLFTAHFLYPKPQIFEIQIPYEGNHILRLWLYFIGAALVAAGYADFPLIAFHFEKMHMPDIWIPIMYSLALGVSALGSLIFGFVYDRFGAVTFIGIILVSALFAPFVFLGNLKFEIIGMILWGLGMGAQLSLMRAVIAKRIPIEKRSTIFGIFTAGYGIAWFLGSAFMGYLYTVSIPWLVIFSSGIQLAAIPFFL